MRRVLLVLALIAGLAGPAVAQTELATSASTDAVTRGIVAQYQAALVRERRLADGRELAQIAEAEARMRAARRALEIATSDRSAAQAALDASRADYARLVESTSLQNATIRIEVEAFRAEIEGGVAQATPELLAGYQEFADGDRANAWTTLETLLRARAQARQAAARGAAAGEMRQLAQLREVMRVNGEATSADVLTLWDQVAELNPRDFWAQLYRTRLARALNRLAPALAFAQAALDAAEDAHERSAALDEFGHLARARNDQSGALQFYNQALDIRRAAANTNPADMEASRDLTVSLERVGDMLRARNDLEGALGKYREALGIRRAAFGRNPNNVVSARDVIVSVNKIGDVLMSRNDLAGAVQHYQEGLVIARALVASRPDDGDRARDLEISLNKVGDVLRARNDLQGALSIYNEALGIARRLALADPTDTERARDVGVALDKIGNILRGQDDLQGALRNYREGLEISRSLAATDPNNAGNTRDVMVALTRIGRVQGMLNDIPSALQSYREALTLARAASAAAPDDGMRALDVLTAMSGLALIHSPEVHWADVVTYMEAMDRRGQLTPSSRSFLETYRGYAAAEAREQGSAPAPPSKVERRAPKALSVSTNCAPPLSSQFVHDHFRRT